MPKASILVLAITLTVIAAANASAETCKVKGVKTPFDIDYGQFCGSGPCPTSDTYLFPEESFDVQSFLGKPMEEKGNESQRWLAQHLGGNWVHGKAKHHFSGHVVNGWAQEKDAQNRFLMVCSWRTRPPSDGPTISQPQRSKPTFCQKKERNGTIKHAPDGFRYYVINRYSTFQLYYCDGCTRNWVTVDPFLRGNFCQGANRIYVQ
jgi:hypothetical protein